MKRVFVTCNGNPLEFELPNRGMNEVERQLQRVSREGFDDLALAFAHTCMNVGYMVARSDLPVHLPFCLGSFYDKPPIAWQQTGEGTWELRVGPLLYVATLQEVEDDGRALEQPLSA